MNYKQELETSLIKLNHNLKNFLGSTDFNNDFKIGIIKNIISNFDTQCQILKSLSETPSTDELKCLVQISIICEIR